MNPLLKAFEVLKPPPPVTVSEWSDRYRILSGEASAEIRTL